MNPSLRQCVASIVVIGTMVSVLGARTGQHERSADAQPESVPVNSVCLFSERPVRSDSPSANYRGYTFGFCCRGCEELWQSLSEPEKYATLEKIFPGRTPGSPPPAEGLSVARAYLSGLNAGQLASLGRLFLPEGRSSILEDASDEGSWEQYRYHHLKPEMESATNFKFTVTDEKAERFGSTVLVRQVGRFTVRVGEKVGAYRAAITYVIVEDAGDLKIAHLHWSSRPDKN